MIGQTWAHLLGLGYLYPEKYVRSALQSVWKYNWAPNVGPQIRGHRPELHYADPGEAGLLLCTWPKGPHMGPKSVRYRDTVWAGIEYQVAAGMIFEGMITEGLSVVRGVHQRYDPAKHNPWNSILCGDHYSRDMASWGCLLAAGGYTCDCPAGKIGFAPRLSAENFRSFFTAAEGWGNFQQRRSLGRQSNCIEMRYGSQRLKTLQLEIPSGSKLRETTVTVAGQAVPCQATPHDHRVTIALKQPLRLKPEQPLDVEIGF
jgi:non-lysosomal glucosylceramidase